MARFTGGWVSISRKIFWPDKQQNDFYGDGALMAIWSILIAWANVYKGSTRLKGQQIMLDRGQLVTSEPDLVRATGFTRSVVRHRLNYLETSQRIKQHKSPSGTIVTILKYEDYQVAKDVEEQLRQQLKEQLQNNEATTGQQPGNNDPTHIEQINNSTKKQRNKKTRTTVDAAPKSPPPGSEVWGAYSEAYKARYRNEPKRNAKANALCKQLVDRLGKDDAIRVVEFYLSHNKSWYLQKAHSLDPCVADCEGLYTQMIHNHRVTGANARQEEVRQTNLQTFQTMAERMIDEQGLFREVPHDEQ